MALFSSPALVIREENIEKYGFTHLNSLKPSIALLLEHINHAQ